MISHVYTNILSLILQYPKHETPGLKNLDNEAISSIRSNKYYILPPHGDQKETQADRERRKMGALVRKG